MVREKPIGFKGYHLGEKGSESRGFTLVELLVVISIMSLLMGILIPVLSKARHQALTIVGMNNQKQIVTAVNLFAFDNDEFYPQSVSFVEYNGNWNWYDPRTLASWNTTPLHPHRAMSEYLRSYIKDASMMFCPKAPKKFKYLQEAWDAGDEWNNPDTTFDILAVRGAYCFYWNYTGWLDENTLFRGPRGPSDGGRGQSKLLMTCYLGYDHRRTPEAYGSCERLKGADLVPETLIESAWWSRSASGGLNLSTINVKLHAAYMDGHVESFTPSEAVPMKAIMNRFTNEPYPSGMGPGDFYLPRNGLR
ncbi:MAG: type II secretion system protein [Planctomycetes bacterium]|nr:type II secretion system protein [Planctomycetota bacterium]